MALSQDLAYIKWQVRRVLGLDNDTDGLKRLPEPALVRLINQAQLEVRLDLKDKWEEFTSNFVPRQRGYELPNDFIEIRDIYVNRDTEFVGYKLLRTTYDSLDNSDYYTDNYRASFSRREGRPERYAITTEDNFYVDPLPASASRFDIFYYRTPTELVNDTDIPDFNPIYHEIVVAKAKHLAAQAINSDLKNGLLSEYEILAEKRRALLNRRENDSVQMAYNPTNVRSYGYGSHYYGGNRT